MTLVGNVGEVPRVSERDGEAFVANFPLATNEVWRDKEGEEVRRTEWHRIVVWNKAAEIVRQHVNKGDALYLEGKISASSWDDKEGNKRYTTEIVANQMLMLGSREGGSGDSYSGSSSGSSYAPSGPDTGYSGPDDDDIPF